MRSQTQRFAWAVAGVSLMAAGTASAVPTNNSWTGAGGDGMWSTASNWAGSEIPDKGYLVPDAGDDGEIAIFSTGTSLSVEVDSAFTTSGLQVSSATDLALDLGGATKLVNEISPWGTPLMVEAGSSLTLSNGTWDANQGDNGKTFVIDGTLTVTGTSTVYVPNVSGTGTVVVESGGVLQSTNRTLGGDGRLEINGGSVSANFINLSGTQAFELNNTDYGTHRLDILFGSVSGLGNLEISLATGFTTEVGDIFQLVGGGSVNVDFDNYDDGDTINVGDYAFEYNYDTGNKTIYLETVPVPEPASLALLGLGCLMILGRKRRTS